MFTGSVPASSAQQLVPSQLPAPSTNSPALPSAPQASRKRHPPEFYIHWMRNHVYDRADRPLTASMFSQADTFDDGARIIQMHIGLQNYEDGQAHCLCLPSQLGHELSKERDPGTSLQWDVILEHCGFPGDLTFLLQMLTSYKEVCTRLSLASCDPQS